MVLPLHSDEHLHPFILFYNYLNQILSTQECSLEVDNANMSVQIAALENETKLSQESMYESHTHKPLGKI